MAGENGESNGIQESEKYDWEIDMSEILCMNLLATGAYGRVLYGTYKEIDVAVKLMNLPFSATDKELNELKSSFKQEITVWSKLNHPNIVQFLGASLKADNIRAPLEAGIRSGQPLWAIVMEFMGGGTLKNYLNNRRTKIPMSRAIKLILDVAKGLEYLHALKIVHRDLKSENVLMDGNNSTAKIADFGVARIEALNPVDMTCETGTVRWMAPEVIDHKPYDRKADLYSFAIVMWEVLTLDHPYKHLPLVRLAMAVVHDHLRPDIPSSMPKELATILENCWQPDPEKRPEFSEVVKDLEDFQANLGNSGGGGCACTIA